MKYGLYAPPGMVDLRIAERLWPSKLHVACATNLAWLPHCATMLHSLMTHQRQPVHVHFLGEDDVAEDLREGLAAMVTGMGCELSDHRVPAALVAGLTDYIPPAQWYRVFLPELLPELDRVLYLDSDIIVTDSLKGLWRVDISRYALAAVTTVFPSREWGVRHCASLGLSRPELYFNSGVILMNLDELRRSESRRRVCDYAIENIDRHRAAEVDEASVAEFLIYARDHPDRLLFPEQDSMNAVLAERRLEIEPRWNCMHQVIRMRWSRRQFGEKAVAQATNDPAIRHFEGGGKDKPWNPDAERTDAELYWQHRRQTPWPSVVG